MTNPKRRRHKPSKSTGGRSSGESRVRHAGAAAHVNWLLPGAILIGTITVFLPALRGEFVSWDDHANFVNNPWYRGLGLRELRWMWTTFHLGHYVPLTWMTHGLDYLLWGMRPAGYHFANVLLHGASAVLVYLIALRLYRLATSAPNENEESETFGAAVAALFFALHPLRVESVAWVTERRDTLSLFFYCAAILSYLEFATRARASWKAYAAGIGFIIAALLSKATAVTLPGALFLMQVYPLRRLGGAAGWWTPSAKRVYLELAPFALLSLATGVLSLSALQDVPALTLDRKVAVSFYSLAFYLYKTVVPFSLSPLYEMPVPVDPWAPAFVASYGAVAVLLVVAIMARTRWPVVTAALVSYFVIVFPLLGVVQNGPQIAADRYTYNASLPLALLVGAALTALPRRRIAIVGAAVMIAALAALTWKQTLVWRNSESLWRHALAVDSSSGIALNNLGIVAAEQGRSTEAIALYARAAAHRPLYAEAHNNWGYELAMQGNTDEAIEHYRLALQMKPDYTEAEINWGNALVMRGLSAAGIEHFRNAERMQPDHPGVQLNWGVALARQRRLAEALERFERALALNPHMEDARAYRDRAIRQLRDSTH